MATNELLDLAQRTRDRNAQIWRTLDFGGIMIPLLSKAADLDTLGNPSIESFIAISAGTWGEKEYQRDRTVILNQAEVDQDRLLADEKAQMLRAKLAIEWAADEYVLAVKAYDAEVRGLLMAAKEFAGQVEQEALAAEAEKASVDVEKEGVRQQKLSIQVQIEAVEQAQVAGDLAKAKVEVAKAHVRAAMAGIEVGRAEIEVVDAEVQVAMAEGERATLEADIAMAFAEAVTHQLSGTRLAVGAAEIAAGYSLITTKLSDAQALYGARALVDAIKADAEGQVLAEIAAYQGAKQLEQTLREAEAGVALAVVAYEAGAVSGNIAAEAGLRSALVAARNAVSNARTALTIGRESSETAGKSIINAAHIVSFTSQFHERTTQSTQKSTRHLDTNSQREQHTVINRLHTDTSHTDSIETIVKG